MEIEKDNPLPFLDTTVARDSDGLLNTTVYRKPTHTDHYLAYDSFLSQWSVVLLSVCTAELNTSQRNRQLFKFMTVLLYIKGVSEVLRRCLQHQGIRTVFKSETTLRFHLVPPRDDQNQRNKTVSFTRSPVNAARCLSVKQGDQCEKG